MNKVFHYYYSKKGINSVSSRPVGSSSGIIKLSENNYNNINLETTIKKNLQNSNNNSSINNSSIKFNTKNQIKLTKNNFTTLPETNNNQNNYLNQNNHTLFFNNKNDTSSTPKEINFDFYKMKDNSNQVDKSPNVNNIKIDSSINKNKDIKNNLTSDSRNIDNNNFSSIKNKNIITNRNTVDLYKKSL